MDYVALIDAQIEVCKRDIERAERIHAGSEWYHKGMLAALEYSRALMVLAQAELATK